MKNTFGNNVSVTLFGESHGEAIGAVIDGLAPGINIDLEFIKEKLSLRRPSGNISTSRREPDEFKILSGVFEGKTTGTPICIMIPNVNKQSKDYSNVIGKARPGHADFAAFAKYHGNEDYRGGGHFSGRITAALVAVGAVCQMALQNKGIYIGTHIKSIADIKDRDFANVYEDIKLIEKENFPLLDKGKEAEMKNIIEKAREELDSVGGRLQTAIVGIPAGVGEPWFDSMESVISHAVFSVPAVKGIEFGAGFGFANMKGSRANDSFFMDGEEIKTKTNNNGGINGGITNGSPIVFNTVIKPTPSIAKTQNTVDFINKTNAEIQITGRHDPCIVHRAASVINSLCAITVCDMLATRFGTDFLGE